MPRKNNNIKKSVNKPSPPPPKPITIQPKQQNNNNNIFFNNMLGGFSSGIGVGAGHEIVKGVSNTLFGNNNNNNNTNISQNNCKLLSEMIEKCQQNNIEQDKCQEFIDLFSTK